MPTYEYGCSSCGHQWEEIQRITAAATEQCPKCQKPTAHRLISGGTNFILKGGGWYSDLYASSKPSSKNSDSSGSGSSDSSSKSSPAPSESKSETKASSPPAASSSSGSSST